MPVALSLVAGAPPATPPLPFGDVFEHKVITLLLLDSRFGRMVRDALSPEHFIDQQHRILAEHALAYLNKYRTLIDPVVLLQDFIATDRRVPPGERPSYAVKVMAMVTGFSAITDARYVEDKLLEWARNQTLLQVAMQMPNLIENGRVDELNRRFGKAMLIGQEQAEEEIEYFSTAVDRRDRRLAVKAGTVKRGVPTGWPEIDKHINAGGWERRGLTIILAPTKRGKTAFKLQSALLGAATYGAHNLFISLEVSEDVATDRLDAALTGIPIEDLASRSVDVANIISGFAATNSTGKLWIMRRATNSLTIAGLEGILDRHRDMGRKLDAVFVDYVGIMKTRSEYRYEDLGHLTKELRRLADVYDVAMITGYQTNRDGMGKQVAGAESMGDSFVPAQDCDLMLSLNADEGELKAGIRRIYWALARNEAQVTLRVQSDLAKGRLIDSIIGTIL